MPTCEDVATTIPDLQTPVSPSGITGQTFLGRALGTYEVQFRVPDQGGDPTLVSAEPNSHERSGTLTIAHEGGEFRHTKSTYVPCDARQCADIGLDCKDYFEAEVVVVLKSQDGAFNERWRAILRADDPSQDPAHSSLESMPSTIGIDLDPESFAGSFRIIEVKGAGGRELSRHDLRFAAIFENGGLKSAQLSSYVESKDRSTVSQAVHHHYTIVPTNTMSAPADVQ